MSALPTTTARASRWAPPISLPPEAVIGLLCLYWSLTANRSFLVGARNAMEGASLSLMLVLGLMLALLHFVLVAPLVTRYGGRLVLAVMVLVAAVSSHFVQSVGAVIDPDMLRNVLRTHWTESRELLNLSMLTHVLVQAVPAWWFLSQVRMTPPSGPWWRSPLRRSGTWLLAVLAFLVLLFSVYQPVSSLMRNHKALRYQILPAAPLWSTPRSLFNEAKEARRVREPIGQDAQPGPSWQAQTRPRVLVLVVGETVRSANWGSHTSLDGSARNTAPLTGALPDLALFPVVQSCGTHTESSLPCMFAPIGRRDYDEDRIRRQLSLMHVLHQAGVGVRWRNNQSGCKGVCEGLPIEHTSELPLDPALCPKGQCRDEALLHGLAQDLAQAQGTQVWVLHMLGNHGPAYHRRVPPGATPYQPYCAHDDLGRCSRVDIVNAYDNALRHTDALLAQLWQTMKSASNVDTALIFIPDHGESLGERGMYLHGLPYAVAPREQTEVPMLLGLSPGFAQARGWTQDCLRSLPSKTTAPQHDHLFHTVLTLVDVRTQLYDPQWDLMRPCQNP
ncbi:MAG: phosphoethanolamine transferase [Inhella sp.]|uniref:phosphoethanolamine transferase n=1 Tax=Inhella sp. TaxID=1921806 RepID=UPI00391F43E3